MNKYDVTVIGAGPGGYPAAIRAAQLGANVAIVERDSLGGTCLNWGCIPTKTLIASSHLFHQIQTSKTMGLVPGENSFDFAAISTRKNAVVDDLRTGVRQLLKANKITVYQGHGSFLTRNRIRIEGDETETVQTAKTIIATGSASAVPGFIPESKLIVDSKKLLAMTELPASMIVLGGGVIGCEFACLLAQLGVKVTLVEMLDDILPMLDRDIRGTLRKHMEEELGIKVMTGAPMQGIKATAKTVSGTVVGAAVKAKMMLVAIGRVPVTEGLELSRAGLETTESGHIEIDECCRTRSATVLAIGDVTSGSTQLAHAATAQGIAAAETACGNSSSEAETLIPACIYTSPEIGVVGLSEQEAKEQELSVTAGKFPFASLGRARAAGETDGLVKLVADAGTDQLLGAAAVGPHATELVAEAALAIRHELTVEDMGQTVHCHPSFSEAWMEAAHQAHGKCIHGAPSRRRK